MTSIVTADIKYHERAGKKGHVVFFIEVSFVKSRCECLGKKMMFPVLLVVWAGVGRDKAVRMHEYGAVRMHGYGRFLENTALYASRSVRVFHVVLNLRLAKTPLSDMSGVQSSAMLHYYGCTTVVVPYRTHAVANHDACTSSRT